MSNWTAQRWQRRKEEKPSSSGQGQSSDRWWNIHWHDNDTFEINEEGSGVDDECVLQWVKYMEEVLWDAYGAIGRAKPQLWASTVNFSRGTVSDYGVQQLMNFLVRWKVNVERLKLFRNHVTDDGAWEICRLLDKSPTPVKEVHLSHNYISEAGALIVFKSIAKAQRYPAEWDGKGLTPLWLRMECNQIDWDKLERQISNLKPPVHWITSTSRDQWKRHAGGYYPAVAMHQSYKSQSAKSEDYYAEATTASTGMAWKSKASETSLKPIGAGVSPAGASAAAVPAGDGKKPKANAKPAASSKPDEKKEAKAEVDESAVAKGDTAVKAANEEETTGQAEESSRQEVAAANPLCFSLDGSAGDEYDWGVVAADTPQAQGESAPDTDDSKQLVEPAPQDSAGGGHGADEDVDPGSTLNEEGDSGEVGSNDDIFDDDCSTPSEIPAPVLTPLEELYVRLQKISGRDREGENVCRKWRRHLAMSWTDSETHEKEEALVSHLERLKKLPENPEEEEARFHAQSRVDASTRKARVEELPKKGYQTADGLWAAIPGSAAIEASARPKPNDMEVPKTRLTASSHASTGMAKVETVASGSSASRELAADVPSDFDAAAVQKTKANKMAPGSASAASSRAGSVAGGRASPVYQ
mmetsp:Transcript_75403/g.140661  ORF Transcript_75403/g.140661 Transcript_75403/m.140661 type:complete len:641 (+) Transcript_75403:84-2006(+)